MPDINGDKKALRARYRTLRASREERDRLQADRIILERLCALEAYRNARLLLTYVSEGSEPDTLRLMVSALAEGKSVACPRCDRESHTMIFHHISSIEQLSPGAYGIYEPPALAPGVEPEELQSSLCIVPGLAFDRNGGRLGYGGGYYDRFLAGYPGTAIGLCRKECLSDDELPRDTCDVSVTAVVTD